MDSDDQIRRLREEAALHREASDAQRSLRQPRVSDVVRAENAQRKKEIAEEQRKRVETIGRRLAGIEE